MINSKAIRLLLSRVYRVARAKLLLDPLIVFDVPLGFGEHRLECARELNSLKSTKILLRFVLPGDILL